MTTQATDTVHADFERLIAKLAPGSHLREARRLTGGISAQITALTFTRPNGETETWVLRQHGAHDYRRNPQCAAHEFRLLQRLQAAGIPVPTPYAYASADEIFATPYIVIEYIEGQTDFAPSDVDHYLRQMVKQLAAIHQINNRNGGLTFMLGAISVYDYNLTVVPDVLDESLSEGLIRATLQRMPKPPPPVRPVLQHNDYWAGNLMWRDGQLVAILDWEDAGLGDPVADLASTRLETLWILGREAMEALTRLYQELAPIDLTHLPYWDLCKALRPCGSLHTWGLPPDVEQDMREKHRWFLEQAITAVNS